MRRILVTFGDGRTGWKNASRRLLREARATDLFEWQLNLDLKWLRIQDPESSRLITLLRENKKYRGFGYWIWKPSILHWAHKNFPNSHIVYVDAGSHLRSDEGHQKTLESTLIRAENFGSLAWDLPKHNEIQWTKSEAIALLDPPFEHLLSNQVQGGYISIPPSKNRKEFTEQWREISLLLDGFYFTDELRSPQSPEFKEHRHDQSILSLLWKQYQFYSEEDKTFPSIENDFPIISSRNNTSLKINSDLKRLQARRYFDLSIDKVLGRK
jgi:hypothetical protein